MKIYKYFAILTIALFMASCEKDDDTAVAAQTNNIQVIVEPFGTTSATDIIGQVGANSAEVEFGFRLTDTTTHFGSDVVITFEGDIYRIPAGDTEVIVGPTIVNFNIPAPTGTVPYNGTTSVAEIDLAGTTFDFEVMNRPNDLVVLKGAGSPISISATVYGQLPAITAGQVNFLFDWNPNHDGGNDLDLRVRMVPGDIAIEYSGSVSNYEDVDIADSDMDGMYEIKADAWLTTGFADPIDGILFAMHPDGTLEVFETDLTGITFGGIPEEVVLVNVTKSTDAVTGEVTYDLYQ
ncbi:MAG: hypothetical protein L3J14_03290 [Flavobacteriaceae bacterium]|nr:hypothetical protein [Flavobacteriaceae bacterium]